MINPTHHTQFEAMEAEARADVDPILWRHWDRIITNDGRDGAGDLVFSIPTLGKQRFDPPGYKVERLRWQGGFIEGGGGACEPGELHDPPMFGWSWRGDAGFPPGENITIGVRGTEGLFTDYITNDEATARAAAWVHYDKAMEPLRRKRLYPGG